MISDQQSSIKSFSACVGTTSSGKPNQKNIQSKRLIIKYEGFASNLIEDMQFEFQTIMKDKDLRIIKSSWSETSQIFYIYLSFKRKLSIDFWARKLVQGGIMPRMMQYDKEFYDQMTNEYETHWPERYKDQIFKIISKQEKIEDFVDKNCLNILNLNKLSQNIQLYDAKKRQAKLAKLNYPKKRGIWLFGSANSGKTTMAVKMVDGEIYYKDGTTQTFDDYRGQQNIIIDQVNITNAKKILPILKNLVNVTPGRFNIKFSTCVIHPRNVVITTQYSLQKLTNDSALKDALRERFHFYYVTRDQYSMAKQFKIEPNDLNEGRQFYYDINHPFVMSRLQFIKYEQNMLQYAAYVQGQ